MRLPSMAVQSRGFGCSNTTTTILARVEIRLRDRGQSPVEVGQARVREADLQAAGDFGFADVSAVQSLHSVRL
jgi:hypothetical protein